MLFNLKPRVYSELVHLLRLYDTGIWTKDLKQKSNLPQTQITKIFKTLEGRKLIKAVKHGRAAAVRCSANQSGVCG